MNVVLPLHTVDPIKATFRAEDKGLPSLWVSRDAWEALERPSILTLVIEKKE